MHPVAPTLTYSGVGTGDLAINKPLGLFGPKVKSEHCSRANEEPPRGLARRMER